MPNLRAIFTTRTLVNLRGGMIVHHTHHALRVETMATGIVTVEQVATTVFTHIILPVTVISGAGGLARQVTMMMLHVVTQVPRSTALHLIFRLRVN